MNGNALRMYWAPRLLSVLRIISALLFMVHGSAKGFGVPTPGAALTPPMIVAALLEPVGGILLVLGIFSRSVALLLSGEMAVAYFRSFAASGLAPLVDQGEPAILFCLNFLYIAAAGPGPWGFAAKLGAGRPAKPL
jgi:putative oxidoreductase